MRTRACFSALIITAVLLVSGCGAGATATTEDSATTKSSTTLVIGIAQLVSASYADLAIGGFKAAMAEQIPGRKIEYMEKNAQGDLSVLDLLSRQMVQAKPDLIYVLGTPLILSMIKVSSDIPVLFGLPYDPLASGMVKSLDAPGGNVTGTSSKIEGANYLDIVKVLKPGAKSVGFLGNPAEQNTASSLKVMELAAEKAGITLRTAPITTTGDIVPAIRSLSGRVDALIVTVDNTAMSALKTVGHTALQEKLPLIANDPETPAMGGLVGIGGMWPEMGAIGARQAKEILIDGKKPGVMPVWVLRDHPEGLLIHVGAKTAQALGIDLSKLDLPTSWITVE